MSFRKIDKHFQQFLIINKIISNYPERKRQVRRVESIWTESNSSLARKFSHLYIRKKDARTGPFVFILSSENWMYFTEKNIIFSSKYFDLDSVFSYQIQEMTMKGVFLVFHNVVLLQGASCSSLSLVFR